MLLVPVEQIIVWLKKYILLELSWEYLLKTPNFFPNF